MTLPIRKVGAAGWLASGDSMCTLVDELMVDKLDDYDFMDNHRLDIEEIAREQAHDAYEEDAMRDRIVGMLDNGDFDYQLEKAVKKVLKEVADGFAHS